MSQLFGYLVLLALLGSYSNCPVLGGGILIRLPACIKKGALFGRQPNEPTSQQPNDPTSQREDCSATWSCWLHWHLTPFVPCWGEGSSSSSQHASRRVLCLANDPTSQRANKPTSQQANEKTVRLAGLVSFVGIVLRSSRAGGRDPHPPPSMHQEGCFVRLRRTGTFLTGA
jgi:hypothetical protein